MIEATAEGVRLLTVHAAKGLEYPIVILADMSCNIASQYAQRFLDPVKGICAQPLLKCEPFELSEHASQEQAREYSEGIRVAYVAATRARDLLVVPAVGDEAYGEGWIAPLNDAIYPAEDRRRVQTMAGGCPQFASKDSVLDRPDGDPATRLTVCPGEHAGVWQGASYSMVWWSPEPGALELGAQPLLGLRRDDLIVKDVSPTVQIGRAHV